VKLPRIAALQARDAVEGGIVGEAGKGLRDPFHWILYRDVKGVHGVFEHASFSSPDAAHTPAGDRHLAGSVKFKAVLRAESVDVLLEECVEFFPGLAFQHHAIGIKAVSAAIAGGAQFPFGCFGPTGERPVGS
jgi:hypothetical protein